MNSGTFWIAVWLFCVALSTCSMRESVDDIHKELRGLRVNAGACR